MATVETTDDGITQITEIENNVEIHNMARFAVDQHNKIQNSGLEFVKVHGARKQDVADTGSIYYIILEAKDGDNTTKFETQVLVKESLNSMELLEFTPLAIPVFCYCGPPPTDEQSFLSST